MKRVTVDEARLLADLWKAQREERASEPNAAYFGHAGPHDLVRMWKSGKNLDGKKLTKREFGCLVERWVEVFDGLPPSKDDGSAEPVASPTAVPTSHFALASGHLS